VWLERLCAILATGLQLFALACQSVGVVEAPVTLSCPRSLDDYCATDPLCVRRIDPSSESSEEFSYCNQVGASVAFDIFHCPLIDFSTEQPVNSGNNVDYLFSPMTGDLVAVVGGAAGLTDAGGRLCLAGPPTLTFGAGPPCVRAPVGRACIPFDASPE
jgi:hypothetical protein